MPVYVNELSTAFTGRVDSSFPRAVDTVASSLSRLRGEASALSGANKHLDKTNKVMATGAKVGRQYSNSINGVGGALQNMIRYAAAGTVIAGVTRSFGAGLGAIIAYDQALRNLEAISGESREIVQSLGDTILEVSNRTKFSADEIGNAAVTLAQAGFSIGETRNTLGAVAELATGTLSALSSVADLTTTAIRAYQLEATEATRVTDVFAAAVNSSKLNIEGLRTSFNFVGATAAQTGVTIEETAAAMAILANSGLRASTIGTGLRKILARLQAPTSKFRDEVARIGVNLDDINPKIVGFEGALSNLSKILVDQETGIVDTSKSFKLFGLRGAQAATIIASAFTTGGYKQALDNIYEVGAAQRQAETQAKGLEVQLKNLQDRWKNVAIALGEAGVSGALRSVIKLFSELGLGLQESINTPLGDMITRVTLITAGLAALVPIVTTLTSVVVALGTAISASLNIPVALGIVAIGTLLGSLASLEAQSQKVIATNARAAQEARALVENYDALVRSISILSERQERQAVSGREVEAFTDRLIQKYPELAAEIEATSGNLKELTELFEALAQQQRVREIESLTHKISGLQQAIANITAGREVLAGDDIFGISRTIPQTEENMEILNTRVKELKASATSLGRAFAQEVSAGSMDATDALNGLRSIFKDGEGLNNAVASFNTLLKVLQNDLNNVDEAGSGTVKVLEGFPDVIRKMRRDIIEGLNPERIIKFNKLINAAQKDLEAFEQLPAEAEEIARANLFKELAKDITAIGEESEKTSKKVISSINAERGAALELIKTQERRILRSKEARDTGIVDVQELIRLSRERLEVELEAIARREQADIASGDAKEARAKAEADRSKARQKFIQREIDLAEKQDEVDKRRLQNQRDLISAEIEAAVLTGDLERVNNLKLQRLTIERQLATTAAEQLNIQRQINEEQLRQSGSITDGLIAKFKTMAATQKTAFEIGQEGAAQLTETLSQDLSAALVSGELTLQNFGEVFGKIMEQAVKDLVQLIIKQLIYNAIAQGVSSMFGGGGGGGLGGLGGLFSAPVQHGGGRVGETTGVKRNIDPSVFVNAPKYHNGGTIGLKNDEKPTILRDGEEVRTERDARNGSGGIENVEVRINNESNQPMQVSQASSMRQNSTLIIDIVANAIDTNQGNLRTRVRRASSGV